MAELTAERLVVGTDRSAMSVVVASSTAYLLLVSGLVAAAVGAGTAHAATTAGSGWGMLIGMGGAVLAFALGAAVIGGTVPLRIRREIRTVLVVDRAGIWAAFPRTAAGEVFLPWSAVGPFTERSLGRHSIVVVPLLPHVGPDHPGARGLHDPRVLRRLRRTGLLVGTNGIDVGRDDLRAALAHFFTGAGVVPGAGVGQA